MAKMVPEPSRAVDKVTPTLCATAQLLVLTEVWLIERKRRRQLRSREAQGKADRSLSFAPKSAARSGGKDNSAGESAE
jgi:hypothetical protein